VRQWHRRRVLPNESPFLAQPVADSFSVRVSDGDPVGLPAAFADCDGDAERFAVDLAVAHADADDEQHAVDVEHVERVADAV
jgi:hypothetical protein